MINAQNAKYAELIIPQSVATNATATATVSCVGYNYASVAIQMATAAATSTDATLTLTEGDGTTFATATELSMTTAAPNTSTGQIYVWHVDLRKRKKNLKITYTPSGAARIVSANVLLTMAQEAPDTASERGLAGQVVA